MDPGDCQDLKVAHPVGCHQRLLQPSQAPRAGGTCVAHIPVWPEVANMFERLLQTIHQSLFLETDNSKHLSKG